MLQYSFNVTNCLNLAEVLSILQSPNQNFDVLILDLNLSDSQGMNTFRLIVKIKPDFPIIVLTGSSEEDLALNCLREGAEDYIFKDDFQYDLLIKRQVLIRSIRYAIERHKNRTTLINYAIELQSKNQELTTEINNRKQIEVALEEALEKQKELNILKSHFISVASHEFRTPLAVIHSSADILENFSDKLSEEKKQEHLQLIQKYIKHTTNLLDDILLLDQVKSNQLKLKLQLLNSIEFCQSVVKEIQQITDIHTILFTSDYEESKQKDHDPIIYFDPQLLRQIILNIFSNAIKYSPPKTTINCDLLITRSSLILEIKDQGIGIPVEEQKYLFISFYRGTTFRITIPRKKEDHENKLK